MIPKRSRSGAAPFCLVGMTEMPIPAEKLLRSECIKAHPSDDCAEPPRSSYLLQRPVNPTLLCRRAAQLPACLFFGVQSHSSQKGILTRYRMSVRWSRLCVAGAIGGDLYLPVRKGIRKIIAKISRVTHSLPSTDTPVRPTRPTRNSVASNRGSFTGKIKIS